MMYILCLFDHRINIGEWKAKPHLLLVYDFEAKIPRQRRSYCAARVWKVEVSKKFSLFSTIDPDTSYHSQKKNYKKWQLPSLWNTTQDHVFYV